MAFASFKNFRPRRSTKAEWEQYNPILLEGEMGIEVPNSGVGTGLVKIKFGDGVKHWNDLPYGLDNTATSIHGGTVETGYDICLRCGTTNEWNAANPVLGLGEIVFDITHMGIKVGDGVSRFKQLAYMGETGEFDFDFGDEGENPPNN